LCNTSASSCAINDAVDTPHFAALLPVSQLDAVQRSLSTLFDILVLFNR
jgi:hypothetical protein